MTREEAILLLHDMKDTYDEIHENTNYETGYEQMTALDMAIEALEDIERWRTWSHTYDNLISRQGALAKIRTRLQDWAAYGNEEYRRGLYACEDMIISLPSASQNLAEPNKTMKGSDLISRQDAIEAIESNSYGMGSRASVKAIKALPSAEASQDLAEPNKDLSIRQFKTIFRSISTAPTAEQE